MRKIAEAIKEIWKGSIKARKYKIGKYEIMVKPFSITIKKHK